MLKVLLTAAALLAAAPALAESGHGSHKGPNGGPMEDVAGVHAELLVSGPSVTVNVFDDAGKPLSTAGYAGSAMIVSGAERKTLQLTASGTALTGQASTAVAPASTLTLVIKTAAGKSGQAKFSTP